jgi:acyl-CoA thioesterase-2
MAASLDHAVWFHRAGRADRWLLSDLHSLSVSGARGLARGVLHDLDGRLVASITQEALMRTRGGGRQVWGGRPEV